MSTRFEYDIVQVGQPERTFIKTVLPTMRLTTIAELLGGLLDEQASLLTPPAVVHITTRTVKLDDHMIVRFTTKGSTIPDRPRATVTLTGLTIYGEVVITLVTDTLFSTNELDTLTQKIEAAIQKVEP